MIRTALILLLSLTSIVFDSYAQDNGEGNNQNTIKESGPRTSVSEELEGLELYSDIVVIQKKFFEKTSRWELSVSGLTSLNNKFFTSLGMKGILGYHLSERWAIEGQAWYLTQLDRDFTKELEDGYQIRTSDIVTPQGYLGLNLVWTPIYGKLSLQEKSVNPFELFFTLGVGMILTDDSQQAPALNMSFGQIHPLSKNTALRWEIGGNLFSAEGKGSLQGSQKNEKTLSEIFYVSVGASFFLPGVNR